jgi:hypothetical protein
MQPGDYEPGAPPVFVMRYKTWRERFSGDPVDSQQNFPSQWNRPHADRHYAAALWMVWSGPVDSREIDA